MQKKGNINIRKQKALKIRSQRENIRQKTNDEMKHKKHDRKYFMSVFMNGFEIIKKKWMLHDYDEKEESIFTSSYVLGFERDENSLIMLRENEFWNSWDKTVVLPNKKRMSAEDVRN